MVIKPRLFKTKLRKLWIWKQ